MSACTCHYLPPGGLPSVDAAVGSANGWKCDAEVRGVYHGHVLARDNHVCELMYLTPPIVAAPTGEIFHPLLSALCPVHWVPPLHGPTAMGMHALRTWHDLPVSEAYCQHFHQTMMVYPLFRASNGRVYTEPRSDFAQAGYIRPPYVYLFGQGGKDAPTLAELERHAPAYL